MTVRLRFPRGLYGITPEWDDTSRLVDAIRAAHAGGMQVLQWRRKFADAALHQSQLQAVQQLCTELQLPLMINDSWQTACDLNSAGAHLGRNDGELIQARQQLHPNQWLGCSCYNEIDLAETALQIGVDYVAFGAVFVSSVKPDAPHATLEVLRQGRQLCDQYSSDTRAAVVAIGGITAQNAAPLIAAGVDSIAVISSLFEATDIYAEACAFSALFNS